MSPQAGTTTNNLITLSYANIPIPIRANTTTISMPYNSTYNAELAWSHTAAYSDDSLLFYDEPDSNGFVLYYDYNTSLSSPVGRHYHDVETSVRFVTNVTSFFGLTTVIKTVDGTASYYNNVN